MPDTLKERYHEYLKSAAWLEKREQRLKIDGHRCAMCGAKHGLQVHHLTYEHLYQENAETELVTLCKRCHSSMHGYTESGTKRLCKTQKKLLYKALDAICDAYGNSCTTCPYLRYVDDTDTQECLLEQVRSITLEEEAHD